MGPTLEGMIILDYLGNVQCSSRAAARYQQFSVELQALPQPLQIKKLSNTNYNTATTQNNGKLTPLLLMVYQSTSYKIFTKELMKYVLTSSLIYNTKVFTFSICTVLWCNVKLTCWHLVFQGCLGPWPWGCNEWWVWGQGVWLKHVMPWCLFVHLIVIPMAIWLSKMIRRPKWCKNTALHVLACLESFLRNTFRHGTHSRTYVASS